MPIVIVHQHQSPSCSLVIDIVLLCLLYNVLYWLYFFVGNFLVIDILLFVPIVLALISASMGAFMCLILLLCAFKLHESTHYAQVLQSVRTGCKLHHVKYFPSRILYYSNISLTFQFDLLVFGDISPNSGPENLTNYVASSSASYDRDDLLRLRPDVCNYANSCHHILPSTLLHIKQLGIHRKPCRRQPAHRGRKGGCRRRKSPSFSTLQSSIPDRQRLRFAVWNAHSINSRNKSAALCDFVISHRLDILALTETWLTGDHRNSRTLADINNTLPNYSFHHSPRCHSRAGGVGVLLRNGVKMKVNNGPTYQSFEHMDMNICSMATSFRLVVIYRPPPNKKNKHTSAKFLDDFGSFVESLLSHPCKFVLAGDFNVHWDSTENSEAVSFSDLVTAPGFKQHITVPTHDAGHILDLLITDCDDTFVSAVTVLKELSSDHAVVKCLIDIAHPPPMKKTVCYRKLRSVDMSSFKFDITNSSLATCPENDLDSLVVQYNNILHGILDHHAPKKEKTIVVRPHSPWFSDSLLKEKEEKRRFERKWRKSGLTGDKDIYTQQCKIYHDLLSIAKLSYLINEISQCDESQPVSCN